MSNIKWVKTIDNRPSYGAPVLIIYNNVVQNIVYMLDGSDNAPDWFAPYYFEDEDLYIVWDKVQAWFYIDDLDSQWNN
jgi:hypothetical protein